MSTKKRGSHIDHGLPGGGKETKVVSCYKSAMFPSVEIIEIIHIGGQYQRTCNCFPPVCDE
jgi:hypothetical protein